MAKIDPSLLADNIKGRLLSKAKLSPKVLDVVVSQPLEQGASERHLFYRGHSFEFRGYVEQASSPITTNTDHIEVAVEWSEDIMRKPIYQRVAELLRLGQDTQLVLNLGRDVVKDCSRIISHGRILGYNDSPQRERERLSSLPVVSPMKVDYSMLCKPRNEEHAFGAFYIMGMLPLLKMVDDQVFGK